MSLFEEASRCIAGGVNSPVRAFRGVEVPPGSRKVVFRFAPLSFDNLTRAFAAAIHRK